MTREPKVEIQDKLNLETEKNCQNQNNIDNVTIWWVWGTREPKIEIPDKTNLETEKKVVKTKIILIMSQCDEFED